ncbi:MAG: hypothetical protein QHG99_00715 [Methanomicrobiales archaeon]|nr:hypothetical protein [Methanomicrobiales archaeon]
MDRTGLISTLIGIVLIVVGGWGVYSFMPQVIDFILGAIGIVCILIGIFLVIFGILMIRE